MTIGFTTGVSLTACRAQRLVSIQVHQIEVPSGVDSYLVFDTTQLVPSRATSLVGGCFALTGFDPNASRNWRSELDD